MFEHVNFHPTHPQAIAMKRTPVVRSDEEWRKLLTPEQYRILRQAGTERPYSGQYWNSIEPGIYVCNGCGTKLFTADAQFVAHCGWPSFDREAEEGIVRRVVDRAHGMIRIEVRCSVCDSHLGHVFDDGPTSTGERYCINSVAILRQAT